MGLDNLASNEANWAPAPNEGLHFVGTLPMPSSRKPCIFDLGGAESIYIGPYYGSTVTFDTSGSVGHLNMEVGSGPTSSAVVISADKTLTVQGGQMANSSITGAGTLTFAGGGGSFSLFSNAAVSPNTWNIQTGFTVNDSAYLTVGATVWQRGTFNWMLNDIFLNGTFNNLGSFITTTNQTIDGPGSFENNGYFCKEFSNGTTTLAVTFNSLAASDIPVKTGAVNQTKSGTESGTVDVAADALYNLVGNNTVRTVSGTLTLSGAGTARLLGATLKVPAGSTLTSTIATLELSTSAATLFGGGTASHSGRLVWRAGTIKEFGPGKLTVTGPVDFVAISNKNLIDVDRLSLNGASSWTAGNIVVTNSSIENTGTFTISGGNQMRKTGGVGGFTNKAGGTVTKTAGGTTTFDIPFSTSGTLLLNSNTIAFEQGLGQVGNGVTDLGTNGRLEVSGQQCLFHLSSGILRGGGTIAGPLVNGAGEVRIEDNRRISVTGDYTQLAGGKLSYKRDAAGWGAFVVGGTATLDGTLQIDNAGLPGVAGFNAVEAGTIVGQFSATAAPGYVVTYDYVGAPNRVILTPLA